jgi:hypothetical protein
MEEAASILWISRTLRADAAEVRAEARAAAARHDEVDPVVDVVIEREPLRAAHEA